MLRSNVHVTPSGLLARACSIQPGRRISLSHAGLLMFLVSLIASPALAVGAYDLAFSTYLGGSEWEHARDVAVDRQGNIYVVGGTASVDFPTTPGAYSRTLQTGGSQSFGPCDVFVAKFGADGELIWSTLIGGPGYDRAYGVEIDPDGLVCVAGRAGPGFPVKNAFQPDFDGVDNGSYGMQNAFVLKLMPDGSDLAWASYVGVSTLCRDVAVDSNGDVYAPGGRWNTAKTPPVEWFADAYQKEPPGGEEDCGVIKIRGDGSGVLWATWLGGSGKDVSAASIRVGRDGRVYIAGSTFSEDFPTTADAHDRVYNGQADFFVACVTPDGSDLVYGTYLGGAGDEWISTHNLAVDDAGNAYVAIPTSSSDYPVTRGTLQRRHAGGQTDWAVTKLSPTGALLVSTFLGGAGNENADGVYADVEGRVFITGETQSNDFPVTADAWQARQEGGTDAALVILSPRLDRVLYATYLGGSANDNGRSGFLGLDGSLYVTGASDGSGFPVQDAYQNVFAGGSGDWGNGDCILAKFTPPSTIAVDPSVTYQTISGWEATAWVAEPSDPAFPHYRDRLYAALLDDVGITRLRLEVRSGAENTHDNWSGYQDGTIDYQTWRSRRYATINDNADPSTIDWSGFHFTEMDGVIESVVNPLRNLAAARGESLYVNLNYVAFTAQITDGAYIHNSPEEYAEFVLATYLHMQQKYGWVPDAWEVLLEPDNVSQWNGTLLGRAIVATAARLEAAGFDPVFVAPSNTNMGNAVTYFDQMIAVPGVLPYLHEFSYHRYGGVSLQNLQAIASRAAQHGLTTSMLEWWTDGNTYRTLHEDLKIGNNSAWQQAAVSGYFDIDASNPMNPTFAVNAKTQLTRQYYRFVRPGAVRIEALSQDERFDPLAFINKDGGYVVVVKSDAAGEFSVGSLPAGTYGIKYATAGQSDVDLPDQAIRSGQAVLASIPAAGVLTVYARLPRVDDQPPSAPAGLTATEVSSDSITLSWQVATDNVAVAGYKLYRNGFQMAYAPSPLFTDRAVEPGTNYTYTVTAYDAAGNESSPSAPLTVTTPALDEGGDLIGYWKFDEGRGSAVFDSSDYGHDGFVVGATWEAGRAGNALDFDGRGDYVQIMEESSLDNLEALTMAAWIYPRVDSHWHVLDKGDGDKRLYAEGTSLTLDGRIRYTGAHAVSQSVGNTLSLNTWQHVAMTWSRATNTTRLYHNGLQVRYRLQDTGSGDVLEDTSHPFTVGARGALGEVTFFDGLIDEVVLYNRDLSPREIRDLYESVASALP